MLQDVKMLETFKQDNDIYIPVSLMTLTKNMLGISTIKSAVMEKEMQRLSVKEISEFYS